MSLDWFLFNSFNLNIVKTYKNISHCRRTRPTTK